MDSRCNFKYLQAFRLEDVGDKVQRTEGTNNSDKAGPKFLRLPQILATGCFPRSVLVLILLPAPPLSSMGASLRRTTWTSARRPFGCCTLSARTLS